MKETKPTESVRSAQNAPIESEAVDFLNDFENGHAVLFLFLFLLVLVLSRYQRKLKR